MCFMKKNDKSKNKRDLFPKKMHINVYLYKNIKSIENIKNIEQCIISLYNMDK